MFRELVNRAVQHLTLTWKWVRVYSIWVTPVLDRFIFLLRKTTFFR